MAGRLKEKANVEIVMLMRMTRTLLGHRVFTNLIINDERINLAVSHMRQMLRKCRVLDRVLFIDAQTTCACKLPVLRTELDELLNTNDFEIEHPRFGLKALPPSTTNVRLTERAISGQAIDRGGTLLVVSIVIDPNYIRNILQPERRRRNTDVLALSVRAIWYANIIGKSTRARDVGS